MMMPMLMMIKAIMMEKGRSCLRTIRVGDHDDHDDDADGADRERESLESQGKLCRGITK